MKRRVTVLLAVAVTSIGLGSVTPAPGALAPASESLAASPTASAKSCSSGWTHAVIGGVDKCLRAGQFCTRRYDRQYHRYGFHCHRYDPEVERTA